MIEKNASALVAVPNNLFLPGINQSSWSYGSSSAGPFAGGLLKTGYREGVSTSYVLFWTNLINSSVEIHVSTTPIYVWKSDPLFPNVPAEANQLLFAEYLILGQRS